MRPGGNSTGALCSRRGPTHAIDRLAVVVQHLVSVRNVEEDAYFEDGQADECEQPPKHRVTLGDHASTENPETVEIEQHAGRRHDVERHDPHYKAEDAANDRHERHDVAHDQRR